MIQFHETVGGQRFFDGTMLRLVGALESIAKDLKVLAKQEVDKPWRLATEPPYATGNVLVLIGYDMLVAYWDEGVWRSASSPGAVFGVTHWCPLPKGPGE